MALRAGDKPGDEGQGEAGGFGAGHAGRAPGRPKPDRAPSGGSERSERGGFTF